MTSFFGTIETICTKGQVMRPDGKAIEAYETFEKNEELSEICIVDEEDNYCGILTRNTVLQDFGGLYGYPLHKKDKVSRLMRTNSLVVDVNCFIEEVSTMAMERPVKNVYDAVVVLKNKKYFGIVTIKDLLTTAVSIQVRIAAESSPLTSLPGNVVIEEKIKQLLTKDEQYAIMYLDLDNFKAYNDLYGFSNGDKMIKALAESLKKECKREDFLGHIGGDDFVVITREHEIEFLGRRIIERFKEFLSDLYNDMDWERGFIISKNRNGLTEQFPIASLSIAVVTNRQENPKKIEILSRRIAEAKKMAKQRLGDSIIII